MKKTLTLVLALVLAAILCVPAFAADLTPMITIAPEDFANMSYDVVFTFTTDTEAALDIYQTDYFDSTLVDALQAGDTITVGGETITVETVEVDEETGNVYINGGYDGTEGKVTLIPEGGEYISLEDDEYYSQTLQGSATYPLADTVKLQHFVMDDNGLTDEFTDEDYPAAEVKAAIEAAGLMDYPFSVTVSDGKIDCIVITYAP